MDDKRNAPDLNPEELEKTKERTTISVGVVHEAIRQEGEQELRRATSALAWSGLAAGLSMGFSMLAQGIIHHALPDAPWRRLVAGFGYSVGFIIVVLGRQQLFTENTLTPILPLLQSRTWRKFFQVARLWIIVLATNLLGTLLFAWAVGGTDLFSPDLRLAFTQISQASLRPFGPMFLGGIFAGWLIALMVWLLPAAETARVVIIMLLTYTISIAGFPHLIAGSVEAFYLVVTGALSWAGYLMQFMLPTLLGNVLGGVVLVAALNHAQATAGQ